VAAQRVRQIAGLQATANARGADRRRAGEAGDFDAEELDEAREAVVGECWPVAADGLVEDVGAPGVDAVLHRPDPFGVPVPCQVDGEDMAERELEGNPDPASIRAGDARGGYGNMHQRLGRTRVGLQTLRERCGT